MRTLITILLCVALAGSAFAVEKTVTVTPLKDAAEPTPAAPAGVCVFGNENPATWAITDYIYGAETYAVVFDAVQPPCGCPEGFTVEAVNMHMNFAALDVPSTFQAQVYFAQTIFDETLGCDVPGPEIIISPPYDVTISTAGHYRITLPFDVATAPCAYFGYRYAVGMTILTQFANRPDLITDDFPVACTTFNEYGSGWDDLVATAGLPGNALIYADIVCCAPAVPSEDKAWGDVKSLFR